MRIEGLGNQAIQCILRKLGDTRYVLKADDWVKVEYFCFDIQVISHSKSRLTVGWRIDTIFIRLSLFSTSANNFK